jgi:hypothetical protein
MFRGWRNNRFQAPFDAWSDISFKQSSTAKCSEATVDSALRDTLLLGEVRGGGVNVACLSPPAIEPPVSREQHARKPLEWVRDIDSSPRRAVR